MSVEPTTTDALADRIISHLKRFGRDSLRQNAGIFNPKIKPAANALVSDIERYPHAFVLGCVADRQVRAEVAWGLPQAIREVAGDFEFETLVGLPEISWSSALESSGHRLANEMKRLLPAAIEHISDRYDGDAARIWATGSSGATVVRRFLGFDGVGPKIANMAANILIRNFGVTVMPPMPDIAVDTHVLRVFERLGLMGPLEHLRLRSAKQQLRLQLRARELSPKWPGELDWPTWQVGSEWCHARRKPDCPKCEMKRICPTSRCQ